MIYILEFDETTQKFSIHHQKAELKHGNIPTTGVARSNDMKELQYFGMYCMLHYRCYKLFRDTVIESWKDYKERFIYFPKE
jgi:hypothetical protein